MVPPQYFLLSYAILRDLRAIFKIFFTRPIAYTIIALTFCIDNIARQQYNCENINKMLLTSQLHVFKIDGPKRESYW
jgi:hypothetical protein